ncbi:hypothetical protein GCM10009802_25150 [Streptomyces synnematoformans]|uniref:Uncharacterized protein n=1 Tax=Streptomyces synnematoformans TaxID=415721 RepID=A0ABN2Y845_9ACTN
MNGPYMSAVSSRLTPASSAAQTVRTDSSPCRREALYAQLIGMQPRPTAPTRRAAAPIVLRSTPGTLTPAADTGPSRPGPPHAPDPALRAPAPIA